MNFTANFIKKIWLYTSWLPKWDVESIQNKWEWDLIIIFATLQSCFVRVNSPILIKYLFKVLVRSDKLAVFSALLGSTLWTDLTWKKSFLGNVEDLQKLISDGHGITKSLQNEGLLDAALYDKYFGVFDKLMIHSRYFVFHRIQF